MTGFVLALAGLTCGDGGPAPAGEPVAVTGETVYHLHGRWRLVLHADPLTHRFDFDSRGGKVLVRARRSGDPLIEYEVTPKGVVNVTVWCLCGDFRQTDATPDSPLAIRATVQPGGEELLALVVAERRPSTQPALKKTCIMEAHGLGGIYLGGPPVKTKRRPR
jgi:hypothetical protein